MKTSAAITEPDQPVSQRQPELLPQTCVYLYFTGRLLEQLANLQELSASISDA